MKKAKELLLIGDRITAEVAERIGLVNHTVPAEKLLQEAEKFADRLAKIPSSAMEMNKKAINQGYEIRGLRSTVSYGEEMFALTLLSESAEREEFLAVVSEKGLKAAFKWREERFAANSS
jgi:enoyl-CoA hydratase/carnithine racemase